jgi:hypothetical protein
MILQLSNKKDTSQSQGNEKQRLSSISITVRIAVFLKIITGISLLVSAEGMKIAL